MLPIIKRRLQVVGVRRNEPERVAAVGRHMARACAERARVEYIGHTRWTGRVAPMSGRRDAVIQLIASVSVVGHPVG